MTREKLEEAICKLAREVVNDPRWGTTNDDLGVSILGMLLYGYGLAVGRIVMMLDIEDIEAAVVSAVMKQVGSAEKWTRGMVAEAARTAFDRTHNPTCTELIGLGHHYFAAAVPLSEVVDNVFANMTTIRGNA